MFYNDHKDAVDQYDKHCLRKNYSVELEMVSRKWWQRLYWGLWDGALANAYIMAWDVGAIGRHENATFRDRYDFMCQLSKDMISFRCISLYLKIDTVVFYLWGCMICSVYFMITETELDLYLGLWLFIPFWGFV